MISDAEIQVGDVVQWNGVNRALTGTVKALSPCILVEMDNGSVFKFEDIAGSMSLKITRNGKRQ